jgi:predicted metal-dependent hydrolase
MPLDALSWQRNEEYLYGLDLFDNGLYWEAHEIWEGLWHAAGRRGTIADFLKGLIRLAAAGVKHREGRPAGVKSHSARAVELLREVARAEGPKDGRFFGLRLEELIALAEEINRDGWPQEAPHLAGAL